MSRRRILTILILILLFKTQEILADNVNTKFSGNLENHFDKIPIDFERKIDQFQKKTDYEIYHQKVIDAEKLIAAQKFSEALQIYEHLFEDYDFIFLREYQIATQLALYLKETEKAEDFLRKGIVSGWQMKSIKRNGYLIKLTKTRNWKSFKKEYRGLNEKYRSGLNQQLRDQVKKMFSKDQWKALGALFRFSSNAQARYAEEKFIPHSEKQIAEFLEILKMSGYPGEKLIGNNFWMSTILSHHNSISREYNQKDKLYPNLRPEFKETLKNGQISPFELALIDEWYRLVKNNRQKIAYGIIESPTEANLYRVNELRETVYLRPVEIRNKLIDIQEKTGMDFYLNGSPWIYGKIEIK